MWAQTRFTQRFGLRWPLVQGPFGGGYSSVKLASSVSNAGGLGSFGAVGLTPAEIASLVTELKSHTTRPFAVNLWVPQANEARTPTRQAFDAELARLRPLYAELAVPEPAFTVATPDFERQVEALLAARPPVFSFVMGVPPTEILDEARRRGVLTIGTATTVDEAVALEAAGVDAIVASGSDAGGHRSTFNRPVEESLVGTMSLVPQIASAVERVSVIAAGGIVDGRGIAAALALGAQGVQLGTAFLATPESGAPPAHRELLGTAEARVTKLTTAFSGRTARGIANAFMNDYPATLAYPARNALTAPLRRAAALAGRREVLALWAGQSAALARQVSASTLLQLLVDETNEVLRSPRLRPES